MQPILSKTSGSRKDTIKVHYHPGPALESTPSTICLLSFTLSILYKIGPPSCSNDGPHQEFRYFQWTISSPVDIITPLNCSLFPNLIPPFFFLTRLAMQIINLQGKRETAQLFGYKILGLPCFPEEILWFFTLLWTTVEFFLLSVLSLDFRLPVATNITRIQKVIFIFTWKCFHFRTQVNIFKNVVL